MKKKIYNIKKKKMPKEVYEIELQGIGKTLKRKTNDIQKTF